MRNAMTAAIGVLLGGVPSAGTAQIGAGADPGSETGTAAAAPRAVVGGMTGAAIGSTRPYYRDYAYRDRVCWHDGGSGGYRHCRWR
jgi:hypothetical protein